MSEPPNPDQLHALTEHAIAEICFIDLRKPGEEWTSREELARFILKDAPPELVSLYLDTYWERLDEQFGACLPWP